MPSRTAAGAFRPFAKFQVEWPRPCAKAISPYAALRQELLNFVRFGFIGGGGLQNLVRVLQPVLQVLSAAFDGPTQNTRQLLLFEQRVLQDPVLPAFETHGEWNEPWAAPNTGVCTVDLGLLIRGSSAFGLAGFASMTVSLMTPRRSAGRYGRKRVHQTLTVNRVFARSCSLVLGP